MKSSNFDDLNDNSNCLLHKPAMLIAQFHFDEVQRKEFSPQPDKPRLGGHDDFGHIAV